jgi:predicted nucleic acid-binding Zn ribbon protein
MARVTRELVVCDVCGSEQDVAAVTVAVDGAEQAAELCSAHRQQLRDAVAGVLGGSTVTTGRRSRPGRKAAGPAPARKRAEAKRATETPAAAKPAGSAASRMPRTTCPHCGMEMGVQNLSRHIAAKHPEEAS